MNKIRAIFEKLNAAYGPQHWWPVTDKGKTKPEYQPREKLTEKQKLEICIGAILTQNTAWKNVEKAMENLQKNKLIDLEKIDNTHWKRVASLIKSSGYYNQKAKKLKAFARFLIREYGGNLNALFEKDTHQLREELLNITGIGPETADSIILYAAQKPIFVIDAYTRRIFSRMGLGQSNTSYDELQKIFHKNLKRNTKMFNEYHALLVEHGKNTCKRNPVCLHCPIERLCSKRFK